MLTSKVSTKNDWLRPSGAAAKGWKSKVEWDEARRIDPQLARDEDTFRNRELEQETRTEIEREALLLKARNKLNEHQKGAPAGAEDQ